MTKIYIGEAKCAAKVWIHEDFLEKIGTDRQKELIAVEVPDHLYKKLELLTENFVHYQELLKLLCSKQKSKNSLTPSTPTPQPF